MAIVLTHIFGAEQVDPVGRLEGNVVTFDQAKGADSRIQTELSCFYARRSAVYTDNIASANSIANLESFFSRPR